MYLVRLGIQSAVLERDGGRAEGHGVEGVRGQYWSGL